ncbi:hypothetical protein ON010_g11996 [Phytophthora cinnamomi]|nr:hypothetical protein ON010_g11996 [Phytophthora cinnamomi]
MSFISVTDSITGGKAAGYPTTVALCKDALSIMRRPRTEAPRANSVTKLVSAGRTEASIKTRPCLQQLRHHPHHHTVRTDASHVRVEASTATLELSPEKELVTLNDISSSRSLPMCHPSDMNTEDPSSRTLSREPGSLQSETGPSRSRYTKCHCSPAEGDREQAAHAASGPALRGGRGRGGRHGRSDPRNTGYVGKRKPHEREAPSKPLHFYNGRQSRAEKEAEAERYRATGRLPARRPVAMKDKQFTNITPAPDNVVEREFLIPDEPPRPKALDLAVIGRPNAGKSSIMNRLLNVTVSAVSPKYNTTRERILGIYTEGDAQLSFYDTPGLIKPKETHEYVQTLVTTAAETLQGVDLSLLVVDSVKRLDESALQALEKVLTTSAQVCSPTMLVMNKFDLVGKREKINLDYKVKELSQMIEEIYGKHYDAEGASLKVDPLAYIGDNSVKVSAMKGYGMDDLKKTLLSLAVDRPWSYHSSMHSDMSTWTW